MVPRGSILTYQFKAATTLTMNGHDIETSVASWLAANGFTVTDFAIVTPSFTETVAAIYGYTVQITMKIRTSLDYGEVADIQSIFDHAVYQAIDDLPSASNIIKVSTPEQQTTGQSTDTGTPQGSPDTGGGGGGGGSGSSAWDSFLSWLEGAGTGAILGIGLAIVGIILIIGWAQSRKLI